MRLGTGTPLQLRKDSANEASAWIPATPEKPVLGESPLSKVEGTASRSSVPNALETADFPAGNSENFLFGGLENQLGDVDERWTAAMASASHAHCHSAGLKLPAAASPMENWANMPYSSLMAAAEATAVSKMSAFTPLMLAQISSSSSALPAGWNPKLLNGKLVVPESSCSDNSHLQRQICTDGFRSSILINLNSSPEKSATNGMGYATSSPSTPVSLDKAKRILDCSPQQVTDLVDIGEDHGSMQGVEIGKAQNMDKEAAGELAPQLDSSPQKEGEMRIENQGVELNNTPEKKTRRKKHRPKVIREGKPARTPKTATPKPVTPKPARNNENPSGKRKYVRRKGVEKTSDVPSCLSSDIANRTTGSRTKSAKRCLNFDSEMHQSRNECPGSSLMFRGNEETQEADAHATSGMLSTLQKETPPEKSKEIRKFDLNSSVDQMQYEYVRAPEIQSPENPPSKEILRMNHRDSVYVRVSKLRSPRPQPSRREALQENLKNIAGNNELQRTTSSSDRLQEMVKRSQLHSRNISKAFLSGRKRKHNVVDEDCLSRDINSKLTDDRINLISENHGSSRHGSYFPEVHKKTRTKKQRDKLTSATSNAWKKCLIMPNNNCQVFTFADAQRFMALKQQQDSQHMLAFDEGGIKTNKGPEEPVGGSNSTCLSVTGYHDNLSTPVKAYKYSTDWSQISNPETEYGHSYTQELEVFASRKVHLKFNTKKRTEKKGCRPHSTYRDDVLGVTAPGLNFSGQNSHHQVGSLQGYQATCNVKGSPYGTSIPGVLYKFGDSVDDIIRKLKRLNISGVRKTVTAEMQNALVPYGRGVGALVSYQGQFAFAKKRRPRPKVDLDPESNRVWKLLMGKENSDEGVDVDKEKWWENERWIFHGRVNSFIARMHLVQGDRRFSPWKGSVVDSVVGVFLTQNVSDHLSSSAFMALAARFPIRLKCDDNKSNAEDPILSKEQQIQHIYLINGSVKWQDKVLSQALRHRGSFVILEVENPEEAVNSKISLGSSKVDHLTGKDLKVHERDTEINYGSEDSRISTPTTVTGSTTAAEAEDRSIEDLVSSQYSFVSSRDSAAHLVQAADQIKVNSVSNFDVEDLIYGGLGNSLDTSTSFIELLQMAETSRSCVQSNHYSGRFLSTDYCGEVDQQPPLDIDKKMSDLGVQYPKRECTSINISNFYPDARPDLTGASCAPYHLHNSSNANGEDTRSLSCLTASGLSTASNTNTMDKGCGLLANFPTEATCQTSFQSRNEPAMDTYGLVSKHSDKPSNCLEPEICFDMGSSSHSNFVEEKNEASSDKNTVHTGSILPDEQMDDLHQKQSRVKFQLESTEQEVKTQVQMSNSRVHETCLNLHKNPAETSEVAEAVQSNIKDEAYNSQKDLTKTAMNASKANKLKSETEKKKMHDWDNLRRQARHGSAKKERNPDTMDSLDWEAVRSADVSEISNTIRERGMNNMLSERIQAFLNRLVNDHGSIDLEWLRDVPPDAAKDYLLSIRGLGLKSVECVRLLTLHHLAFPVDTNVGRICVRLGWVPLQPLPESLQLHLLEMYPVLETIQKYLWPRLCKLDQRTLYELHYQMITFGKVFCTKSKPNCNACPMRGECKHFASAFASARLALPGTEEKGLVSSIIPDAVQNDHAPVCHAMLLPQLESCSSPSGMAIINCEPIIEEPATPEPECIRNLESDIEDAYFEDPEEIPHIKLNLEALTQNVHDFMQANNMELQEGDMSKALVSLAREAASMPTPKLKNVARLRTEHQVYELPDSHPLLEGFDQREPDDPCSYLLAIWTPGETAQSTEPPTVCCNSQDTGKYCDKKTCFTCNCIREEQAQTVRGTLLIPCRTAMRGSFPLNGTYFQVNEVFADHASSHNPIDVPREWIWKLPRRTVYFGTSIPTIFKGLTTEGIQYCFWKGFVCVRGFDQTTRGPRPLCPRLHYPASKLTRNKKAREAEAASKVKHQNTASKI